MNEMPFSSNALLILWVTYATLSVLGSVAALVWATRTRQFSDQDKARYLPLRSGVPGNETTDEHR